MKCICIERTGAMPTKVSVDYGTAGRFHHPRPWCRTCKALVAGLDKQFKDAYRVGFRHASEEVYAHSGTGETIPFKKRGDVNAFIKAAERRETRRQERLHAEAS